MVTVLQVELMQSLNHRNVLKCITAHFDDDFRADECSSPGRCHNYIGHNYTGHN